MTAYIMLILFIILIGLLFQLAQKREKSIWIIMIILILFAGLRGDFTSDYGNYLDHFYRIIENESVSSILSRGIIFARGSVEPGFMLLNLIIGTFTTSEVAYMIIMSGITLFFYFSAFKHFSVDPWLSVLLFVGVGDYFASFNLMRQILAAGICFWSTKYIEEKKLLRYIIWIFVASSIHTTALIMLPMYFILQMHISKKIFVFQSVSATIIWVSLPFIITFFQTYLSRYDNYLFGMNVGTFNAVIPSLGMLIFAVLSMNLLSCSWDKKILRNRIAFNGSLWAVFLLSLCMQVYIVFRLSFYLKPFLCILIPSVVQLYRDKREKIIIVSVMCVLAILYTYIYLSGTGYDPYYFAWENVQYTI